MTAEAVQVPGYVAGKWNVDTVHSHVGFTVRHMMVSKVRGQFKIFDADVTTGCSRASPRESTCGRSTRATSSATTTSARSTSSKSRRTRR